MPFKKGQSGNPGGQWRPGQSGNPNGRPKSRPLKEAIDRVLKKLGDGNADKTMDELAGVLVAKCMTGDIAAMKELGDRYEGKVPTPIGGTDELPAIRGFSWLEPTSDSDIANNASKIDAIGEQLKTAKQIDSLYHSDPEDTQH